MAGQSKVQSDHAPTERHSEKRPYKKWREQDMEEALEAIRGTFDSFLQFNY